MMSETFLFKMMRLILQTIALILGSLSILLLWASFYDGYGGAFAFVLLSTATLITLGLPEPSRSRRR
jgi:hypothetical protein